MINLDDAENMRELATEGTGNAVDNMLNQPENVEKIERLDHDPQMQAKVAQMQAELDINKNLAVEVLSMLFDNETGYLWGSDPNFRYIDLEQEPVFRYDMLRRAGKSEPAMLIKNYRNLQMMDFAKMSNAKMSGASAEVGFTLAFADPNYQPTKEERREIDNWVLILTQKFFFPAYAEEPNFQNFLKTCYNDWFDLDDISIETRRTMDGSPLAFHLCDPQYIKPMIYQMRKHMRYDEFMYQQFVSDPLIADTSYATEEQKDEHGQPYKYMYEKKKIKIAKFTDDYMHKAHFNVSSDFKQAKRGYSVVAQGVRILTYILNALSLNATNFTTSRIPQGLLALTGGSVSPVQLAKIQKLFYAYSTGANNQHRIPMLATPDKGDAKWIPIRNTNREMEYHLWMSLLHSIWAQLSGTNPELVSLSSNKQTMNSGGINQKNEDRIYQESNDVGLRMVLKHFENAFNRLDTTGTNVWQQITKLPVIAKFTGTERKNEKLKAEIDQKRLATDTSINDLLLSEDKEPQNIQFAGMNICDIRGIALPQLFTALNTIEQGKQQEKAQQQQMDAQQAQAGQEQMTPEDQELIAKYGAPEDQAQGDQIGQEDPEPQEEEA